MTDKAIQLKAFVKAAQQAPLYQKGAAIDQALEALLQWVECVESEIETLKKEKANHG